MSSVTDMDNLRNEINSLGAEAKSLSKALTEAGQSLHESGSLPAISLAEDLTDWTDRFRKTRDSLLSQTDSKLSESPIATLSDLSALCQKVLESSWESLRAPASEILRQIEELQYIGTEVPDPLHIVREERCRVANLIATQTEESSSEVNALTKGEHRLAQLIRFVTGKDELDPDECFELMMSTGKEFSQTLAVAITRNEVSLSGNTNADDSVNANESQEVVESDATPPHEEVNPAASTSRLKKVIPQQPETVEPSTEEATDETANASLVVSRETSSKPASTSADDEPEPLSKEEHSPPSEEQFEAPSDESEDKTPACPKTGEEKAHITLPHDHIESAHEVAKAALDADDEKWPGLLNWLIWQLVREQRYGLAFHVSQSMVNADDFEFFLEPWLLRAIALGQRVIQPNGRIALQLRDDFQQFSPDIFEKDNEKWNHAVRMFMVSASLRPALLTPETGASAVLRDLNLKDGQNELFGLCKVVAAYGDQGLPVDLNSLRTVKDDAEWQEQLDAVLAAVECWCEEAPRRTVKLHRATRVWQYWHREGELVHSLLQPVRANDDSKIQEVSAEIERLLTLDEIREEVHRTDRMITKAPRGREIEARVLDQIRGLLEQGIEHARSWIGLHERKPGVRHSYREQQTQEIRDEILRRKGKVFLELHQFLESRRCPVIQIATDCLRAAIDGVVELFDQDTPPVNTSQDVKVLLGNELLKTRLRLSDQWTPEPDNSETQDGILSMLAEEHEVSTENAWQQAFEMHCDARDHEASGRILELNVFDSEVQERLCGHREKGVAECISAFQRDLGQTRNAIEDALSLGQLNAEERNDLDTRMAELERLVEQSPEQLYRFDDRKQELQWLRNSISESRKKLAQEARQRLQNLKLETDSSEYEQIDRVLREFDIFSANEYIDQVSRGLDISPSNQDARDAFEAFFPNAADRINRELSDGTKYSDVVRRVQKHSGSFFGLEMAKVPGAQAEEAAGMLKSWLNLKQRRKVGNEDIRKVLSALGWNVLKLKPRTEGKHRWVDVKTQPLADTDLCPVPDFGSMARGHYTILCLWGRPSEDEILSTIKGQSGTFIVFHFGRMTESRRRNLASQCRSRRASFIVIDDTLLIYLCAERGSRLRVMFECALPFTFASPFSTTASLVPPEVFYGRETEQREIQDPLGSCFIYGGRQLGKTALLRHVERGFRTEDKHQVAKWIDLKDEGIGFDRGIDEIWNILRSELTKMEVLPTGSATSLSSKSLLDKVEDWLNQDERRRILLLLDEADTFLESDAKEDFPRCIKFKGLMDRTARRFKVVFAGLHNVLRTTRRINHPLAHFGNPLCIGPLLEQGDLSDARNLVKVPFAALGYRFESQDLITRILSQTNYYPSLIQIYCNELLAHVSDQRVERFPVKTSPPYIITGQHVDEAYQSQKLRDIIRQRFNLTLQLDQRYEVIAYAIAHAVLTSEGKRESGGFTVEEARELSIGWWENGFENSSTLDGFRAILEEMVGLGVLRAMDNGHRYTLRNPNVVSMLGTDNEIETQLLLNREPPAEYDAAWFRSSLSGRKKLSPLTARQESDLFARKNGVTVISGCKASDLSFVVPFLRASRSERVRVIDPEEGNEFERFSKAVEELKKRELGTTLLLVSDLCAWDEQWVETAIRATGNRTSQEKFVRIAFVADPSTLWELKGITSASLDVTLLGPWHDTAVRQWLSERKQDNNGQLRQQIFDLTGNWPDLLGRFIDLKHKQKGDLLATNSNGQGRLQLLSAVKEPLQSLFGIPDNGDPRRDTLNALAEFGEASADDLCQLQDSIPQETVQRVLVWAERLNLIQLVSIDERHGEKWRIDRLVEELLQGPSA